MGNLAQTEIFGEIHISNFFLLMVIHHCTSFKKSLNQFLRIKNLIAWAQFGGKNGPFGQNEHFLKYSHIPLFLLLVPHHQAKFIKNPGSTFSNREMRCYGPEWSKNDPFDPNRYKYTYTYLHNIVT